MSIPGVDTGLRHGLGVTRVSYTRHSYPTYFLGWGVIPFDGVSTCYTNSLPLPVYKLWIHHLSTKLNDLRQLYFFSTDVPCSDPGLQKLPRSTLISFRLRTFDSSPPTRHRLPSRKFHLFSRSRSRVFSLVHIDHTLSRRHHRSRNLDFVCPLPP